MSRSRTTTNPDWLYNPHAGEMLATEFMEPLGLDATELAAKLGIPASSLQSVIDGDLPMNGDLDLRLARYFGMSEGFFLRLQVSHELLEARRAANGALDHIIPRAA